MQLRWTSRGDVPAIRASMLARLDAEHDVLISKDCGYRVDYIIDVSTQLDKISKAELLASSG